MIWILIAVGLSCSAGAQVLQKINSNYAFPSPPWLASIGAAALLYGVSFLLYPLILKREALSRVGPAMTFGVSILVVLAGLVFFGERFSLRQGLGILLGAGAMFLLLG